MLASPVAPPSGNGDAAPRAQALAALALNHALQGHAAQAQTGFAAAMTQAKQATDPIQRTEALVYLARMIFKAGDPTTAGQVIALADAGS